MSYMDKENILEEGFFDKMKKAFSKQKKTKKYKEFSKNKKVQKKYEAAVDAADKALKDANELAKEYGLPPL